MDKKILITLALILSLVTLISISAYSFRTVYNPFTGKLDYHITGNMSGENVTADYFIGDGSLLTGITAVSASWNRSATNVFLYHTGDKVGIGTITPSHELNVIGDINFTGLIYGNGSQLIDLTLEELDPYWTANQSSYSTTATILGWNYYNLTDFNISDYILNSEEGNLDVNSSDYLDSYDSLYFMPLNTSVSGNFSFNGGWLNNGLSIIDGNIYAQVGYFYNITSLNVSEQNLTVIKDLVVGEDISLGGKIKFAFDEMIDNLVDGWIRITGSLNVTGNISTDSYFIGDGSFLTDVPGSIDSYDTGWVACSDWTNQHLGTALGGNVVHNLATPLRNLAVKVFVSSDGTDANSFAIETSTRYAGAFDQRWGYGFLAVDNNNLIVQTHTHGVLIIKDDGTVLELDTDAYYYRVVVYKMSTVYSGTALDYYETPWINRSDWTNVHLGSDTTKNADSNLNHALNAPLKDLVVKVFISTDGTDADSYEVSSPYQSNDWGVMVNAVDNNNILIQTGANGIAAVNAAGVGFVLTNQDYYYKIKVYKMTAVPQIAARTSYDTGWISNSDWTNQHLGTSVGGNVIHNLDAPLSDVLVKVLVSTDGTDANSFEIPFATAEGGTFNHGLTIFQVDNDNMIVQTGQHGFRYSQDSDGITILINDEAWYYKIKVYKLT